MSAFGGKAACGHAAMSANDPKRTSTTPREKAGDLPVVRPTKFEFVVNLRAAKVIGLGGCPLLALSGKFSRTRLCPLLERKYP